MPRDYARATSQKSKTRRGSTKKRLVWLRPMCYVALGVGVSYAFQHPDWSGAQWQSMTAWLGALTALHEGDDLKNRSQSEPHKAQQFAPDHGADNVAEKKPDLQFYDILQQANGLMHRRHAVSDHRGYTIQVGAFLNPAACQHMVQKLKHHDFLGRVERFERQGAVYCRVLIGGFENLSQAYEVKNRLYAAGMVGVLRQQTNMPSDA